MSARSLGLDDRLWTWLVANSVDEPPSCAALREVTASRDDARMQISPEQGQFLDFLVRLLGVQRIVEVGTYTGYSSLRMALAMPADGRLVACDINPETGAIAQAAWASAGVADRVALRLAPAIDTMSTLPEGAWDLVFIDADKTGYAAYVEAAWRLLRPGGVVAIDNTLWSGKVADPAVNDADTVALRALAAALRQDDRWDLCLVPIGDGLTLLRRR